MQRHELLARLHRQVKPRNYLEIGVESGKSLAYSRVPSIAIDPDFRIVFPQRCDLELVRSTSDEFFARPDPLRHLRSGRNPIRNIRRARPLLDHYRGGTRLDLVFIDGMHLFEYALRDLMNVERLSDWWTVIVLDDMLPRDVDEAARERHTEAWTGDVYKLLPVLARHRSDLLVLPLDTQPTGTVLILGADPANDALRSRYDELVAGWVVPDPQPVPTWILERRPALDPEPLLASGLWADLVRERGGRRRRSVGMARARSEVAALGAPPLASLLAGDPSVPLVPVG